MREKILELSVSSSVLKWARATVGKSIEDVARRLNLNTSEIKEWESGGKKLTLTQLKQLAIFYKRPLAALFLQSPPVESPLPTDFRTLPETVKKAFSEITLLALRRARRLQSLTAELLSNLGQNISLEVEKANLSDSPEELAKRTRKTFGITIEDQFEWSNELMALNGWKIAIEQRSVLVFELRFPIEEGRALSITDGPIPVIVLNSEDAVNGRIFSLFHEYAHLLLGQGGICDFTEENKRIELFCNYFAGELLVPSSFLLSHPLIKNQLKKVAWSDKDIQKLARSFKVSREVILRRLLILGIATERYYQKKRKEWELQLHDRKKVSGGRRIPARQCIRQNGIPFTSLVLESANKEKITYRDVSDYLSISLKHLPKVEKMIQEGKARYGGSLSWIRD